jgi:hypothetical protein
VPACCAGSSASCHPRASGEKWTSWSCEISLIVFFFWSSRIPLLLCRCWCIGLGFRSSSVRMSFCDFLWHLRIIEGDEGDIKSVSLIRAFCTLFFLNDFLDVFVRVFSPVLKLYTRRLRRWLENWSFVCISAKCTRSCSLFLGSVSDCHINYNWELRPDGEFGGLRHLF